MSQVAEIFFCLKKYDPLAQIRSCSSGLGIVLKTTETAPFPKMAHFFYSFCIILFLLFQKKLFSMFFFFYYLFIYFFIYLFHWTMAIRHIEFW